MTASPVAGDLMAFLAEAELRPRGFLANASNHTLMCQVGDRAEGVHAVYKPRAGERPLWDFTSGTLCQREVAAWVVSEALGWGLVPPTLLREGPMGVGSVQLFVPHDPAEHYFTLVEDARWHAPLARMALFDLLANNTDRKGSHVLHANDDRLYGIDHGVTFHAQPKLRTVIWDLGGYALPDEWRADLARLAGILDDGEAEPTRALSLLLDAAELRMVRRRAGVLQDLSALPDLDEDRRPYPWPPL